MTTTSHNLAPAACKLSSDTSTSSLEKDVFQRHPGHSCDSDSLHQPLCAISQPAFHLVTHGCSLLGSGWLAVRRRFTASQYPLTALAPNRAQGPGCSEGLDNTISCISLQRSVVDGDSSVYARLLQNVPYGHSIHKIECANHCIKNYTSNLHTLAADKTFGVDARKLLKLSLFRPTAAARRAIRHREQVSDLVRNLENAKYNAGKRIKLHRERLYPATVICCRTTISEAAFIHANSAHGKC
ncbi:hypothetical protein PR048_000638 [Dryococelus australis]|uniref:Mutator-like transposase domain-containing protein n=1 Tax=Dryococelus australis TaxID=614101 RepID=A0ABQ9IHK2_9NEOP|nr:hypothetical protein PR048_000638 [Dryococelus australis]